MDAIPLLAASFRDLHQALREDFADVAEADFWWQPAADLNHIGFLSWHIVRDEDAVLSYVSGRPELWATDGWHERFAMDAKEQGTGMDPGRLASFRYDRTDFIRYADEVWRRTPDLLAQLTEADLDREAWPDSGWTIARQVVEGCLGHGWLHLGEIRAIRGLRGWRFRE
jgi:hypothetical protein